MKDFLWIRDDVTGSQWEGSLGVFGRYAGPAWGSLEVSLAKEGRMIVLSVKRTL